MKKIIWLIFDIFVAVIWLIIIGNILFRIFTHPLANSAWAELMHSHLFISLGVIVGLFVIINGIGIFISLIIFNIDIEDSDKFINQFVKFSLIIAIITGLLLTESSNTFQLVATVISFALIFQYFFPKEMKDTFVGLYRKLINKRNRVDKNKKKK